MGIGHAGEVLLLRLKAFPQVRHAGSTTRGYLSSILNKPLPDGFHVTLSNEYWVGPDGRVHEGEGIQAEVPIDVFPDDGLFGGHRRAVDLLVQRIGRDLGLG